ncbi:hypothetical protein MT355_21005 [Rathayibacter sp. VKM Ac-2929]|uniref:hypothetical protein n=1 Tax=Rathayibacter sp. VKM Ac-2929 TaxID=2929480 RepID=UPI001FB33AA1|nr:hypothetical protein [Rathayibacter sp. VKM Ac-2929]MCJ1675754.1 hypothetical protein [Rathayibacter sp. VKM Ac-2929]
MDNLEAILCNQMVTYLVSKNIFCPRTGAVLDSRTCVVLNDVDGDPAVGISPEGWQQIAKDPATLDRLAERGLTVDMNTALAATR